MITLRNLWWLLIFVVVLGGCGRTSETTPAPQQSGQAVSPTPINWPVWKATQEAIRQEVEQHEVFMDQTAVAIPTAPIGIDPSPGPPSVLETGWLTHCGSQLSPRLFRGYDSNNCFRLQRDNLYITLFAGGVVADPAQGELIVVTDTLDMMKGRSVPYYTPQLNGAIQLTTIEYPLVYVTTGILTTSFNLETRQWGTENGTPIPATPTATPMGQWVQSLTLFNADTDQPVAGFDPLTSGSTLNFSTLGTHNLNIRANTSPAVVGSVTFNLDGVLVRTETGAPYAIGGNNGTDYTAWTPTIGTHTLVVTPYSGSGGSGTAGTALTISFTVVEGTTSTATRTPTVVPATATPAVATATASRTPTPGTTGGTVLLVVGNATTMSPGDSAVKTRLESPEMGFTVVLKDQFTATTADATGKAVVYISGSVSSGNILAKFRDVTVPVITTEFGIYDDMGMSTTATNDFATSPATTMLTISNPSHPLAAGLTGTITVLAASQGMPYGSPNANGIKISPQGTSNTKAVLFAYNAGAVMPGLTAPARRVGFFLPDSTIPTEDGWKLFDAAVRWAAGQL